MTGQGRTKLCDQARESKGGETDIDRDRQQTDTHAHATQARDLAGVYLRKAVEPAGKGPGKFY